MARWLVNIRGHQVGVDSLGELRKIARAGDMSPGDIVQPPGAAEWIYALEVPELKAAFPPDMFELPSEDKGFTLPPAAKAVIALVMFVVAVGTWSYAWDQYQSIPEAGEVDLLGKKGLSFSQVLVTAQGDLLATAAASAQVAGPLAKNATCDLLAKRGEWYRLRCDGKEGYAKVDAVVPAYFFADDKVKVNYDPLYNPDQYVRVANSAWMQVPGKDKKNVTVFTFMVQNDSKFVMTDLRLQATIKDSGGKLLEQVEIGVEGTVPPREAAMIGTLAPAKGQKGAPSRIMSTTLYEQELKTDPSLADRWTDGVEVVLEREGAEAAITIVEVRAVPPEELAKAQ